MVKYIIFRVVTIGVIFGLFVANSITAIPQNQLDNSIVVQLPNSESYDLLISEGYTNLTIDQVWKLISNSTNGIQFLIDVRTPGEYLDSRIYTPSIREKPRLFPVQLMQFEGLFLHYFMMRYTNQEIILYCRSANRSFIATKILIEHGFIGTIYNMVGGINEWQLAEFPITKGWF
jgi:rhodanese-related sulfurtransferase